MEFRRLRFLQFQNQQRADIALVRDFKAAFGGPEETAVFFGDWGVRQNNQTTGKFREPTKLVGLRYAVAALACLCLLLCVAVCRCVTVTVIVAVCDSDAVRVAARVCCLQSHTTPCGLHRVPG